MGACRHRKEETLKSYSQCCTIITIKPLWVEEGPSFMLETASKSAHLLAL